MSPEKVTFNIPRSTKELNCPTDNVRSTLTSEATNLPPHYAQGHDVVAVDLW